MWCGMYTTDRRSRNNHIWFTFCHRRVLTIWPESLFLSISTIFPFSFSPLLSDPASAEAPAVPGAGEAERRVSETRGMEEGEEEGGCEERESWGCPVTSGWCWGCPAARLTWWRRRRHWSPSWPAPTAAWISLALPEVIMSETSIRLEDIGRRMMQFDFGKRWELWC